MIPSSIWDSYSKKMVSKFESLRSLGIFTQEEADERKMRLIKGLKGEKEEGSIIAFFCLVDAKDGVIGDAKFQAYGDSALLAMGEIITTFIIGKTHEQVKRMTKDLLIKQLADDKEDFVFPDELYDPLILIQEALQEGMKECEDIPLEMTHLSTPFSPEEKKKGEGYPGWGLLPKEQKISVIEGVLNEEIRPYVELDEGGVEILDLLNDKELIIAYKGNCTSCMSSVGTTLSAIQGILREKIDNELVVVPNMDNFTF